METPVDTQKTQPLIIILESAPLKLGTIGKEVVLINSEEHSTYIKKKLNQDPAKYRPDITHQCLLTLLDSPLNKSGRLKIFVRTSENVLISIDPSVKIPRTYKRFASLFAQLLQKLKIRAVNSSKTLLKVIKNPIHDHLPINTLKIGTSTMGKLVDINAYVREHKPDTPIAYIIGAVSKGNPGMECGYADDVIKVSNYSLSASNCAFKIINAYESLWAVESFE